MDMINDKRDIGKLKKRITKASFMNGNMESDKAILNQIKQCNKNRTFVSIIR